MASSGSFNTSPNYEGRYLTFAWSVKSQSQANNSTVISWTFKGAGDAVSSWYYAGAFEVIINGATVYSSDTRIQLYNGTVVASGETTIGHGTDGTKTFSASAKAGIYTYAVNTTGSGSWALPTISRGAAVVQSLPAKTETTLSVNWTADKVVDKLWYSVNNGSTWTEVSIAEGTSGSYTVTGLSAYTTYQLVTKVRRKDNQIESQTSALTVVTFRYPFANSMPDFVLGNSVTIGIYNPLYRSVTVQLLDANNTAVGSLTTSGTSVSGFNTTAVVNALYNSIPSALSGTYKIVVTYGSNSDTKTGGTFRVNTNDCLPVIGSAAYADVNSTVTAITGDDQDIVRTKSTVRYSLSGLAGAKGASLVSAAVAVNGDTYALTISGTGATGGNAAIDSASDVSAVFTVTDSRGLTATRTVTVHMLDYQLPSAIITFARQNNFYTECDIKVDAQYSSINGNNTITIVYAATKEGDQQASVSGTLSDNVAAVIQLDNTFAWSVLITVTDGFGGSASYTARVYKGVPIIYFDRLNSSVGVNCFPDNSGTLEIDGDVYINSKLLSEWVVYSGYDGSTGWFYKVWSDNTVELWGVHSVTPSQSSQAGNQYYSDWLDVPLPFELSASATPCVTGNVGVGGQGYNVSYLRVETANNASFVRFAVTRGSAIGTTAVPVNLHVIGLVDNFSPSGGVVTQAKSATPYTTQQIVRPDVGVDALSQVTVDGIAYEETANTYGTTVTIGTVAPS